MKKLTQAVFDSPECPVWAESAFIDSVGYAIAANVPKRFLQCCKIDGEELWSQTYDAEGYLEGVGAKFSIIDISTTYDTTNWQQSAIDRGEK